MDNFICGGYIFSSNFDSGNLHKCELVKWNEEILPSNNTVGVEFNLWTKPDCGGTEYENLNRSWFFFSVQGGQPDTVCKFNIVNLNKQAKLFSQGMNPVIRLGETGKWERTKDSPLYELVNGDFMLSFFHKPQKNVSEKFYYAFTFPYTYTECQDQLKIYDGLFEKSMDDLEYLVCRLNNNDRKANTPITPVNQIGDGFTDDRSFGALTNMSTMDIENEIYYHRELLIKSVEGRRIDLLTITSFANIKSEREFRFYDLFPDATQPRCHKFNKKKVIFISSRVHPGETPASFVLNGFLKMILDKKNKFASLLRKMYVFKIVPFLNPDGVYNGCYRSDTLGQNLNRVYLAPKIDTQPSIYAVRKMIRYYHDEKMINEVIEKNEDVENLLTKMSPSDSDNANNNAESDPSITPIDSTESTKFTTPVESKEDLIKYVDIIIEDVTLLSKSSIDSTPSSTRSPSSETETSETVETSTPLIDAMPIDIDDAIKLEKCNKPIVTETTVFCDKFMLELKPSITTIAAPLLPLKKNILNANGPSSMKENTKVKKMMLKPTTEMVDLNLLNANQVIYGDTMASPSTSRSLNAGVRKTNDRKKENPRFQLSSASSKKSVHETISLSNRNTVNKLQRRARQASNSNIDISAEFWEKHAATNRKVDVADVDKSNMFLYIDLHGHASKKGIFMYGNHLPNTAEAVECMLLPRLMSMNCNHFHFDACVFSERNMYHKGKRDGLSKEGSGRVAIYKAIGLIKCYTLEANYNTGKYVNDLPPRGKEKEVITKKTNQIPPKYTPAIYEDVGRALAPSILDLTDTNPMSRLRNSDFRTTQGLRNALRNEIERSASVPRNMSSSIISNQSKFRYLTSTNTNTGGCSCPKPKLLTDISKENKGRVTTNTKQTVSYEKKEKPSTLLLARKKGKVLCDVIPTSTLLSLKFNDIAQTQPIPNKRPKVVLTKKTAASEEKTQESTVIDSNVDMEKVSCVGDDSLKIELSNEIAFNDTPDPPIFDPDLPCCSHQIFSQASASTSHTSVAHVFPTKLRTYPQKSTSPTVTASSSILLNQPSVLHVKKSATPLKLRNSFSSIGASTSSSSSNGSGGSISQRSNNNIGSVGGSISQTSLLRAERRSSLGKDVRKVKKKKSLKADTTLKRKKSRVF